MYVFEYLSNMFYSYFRLLICNFFNLFTVLFYCCLQLVLSTHLIKFNKIIFEIIILLFVRDISYFQAMCERKICDIFCIRAKNKYYY